MGDVDHILNWKLKEGSHFTGQAFTGVLTKPYP
jgi:hypothetical protein